MAKKKTEKTIGQYEKVFARLKKTIGADMASYCLCAFLDIPFFASEEITSWSEYERQIREETDGGKTYFADGDTDINLVLNKGLSKMEQWKLYWGEGSDKHPYAEKEYKRLDELKRSMAGQLENMGSLTAQQEDVARQCAIWTLQCEKLSANGDKESVATAKMLDDMKRKNLEDCNMRSRDILPTRQQRPAGFVTSVKERLGIDGEITKEAVFEAFFEWCKNKRYPMTIDAVHKAQLAIIQTIAKNSDTAIPTKLPTYADLSEFSYEFASEPNETENAAYDYLRYSRQDESEGES